MLISKDNKAKAKKIKDFVSCKVFLFDHLIKHLNDLISLSSYFNKEGIQLMKKLC